MMKMKHNTESSRTVVIFRWLISNRRKNEKQFHFIVTTFNTTSACLFGLRHSMNRRGRKHSTCGPHQILFCSLTLHKTHTLDEKCIDYTRLLLQTTKLVLQYLCCFIKKTNLTIKSVIDYECPFWMVGNCSWVCFLPLIPILWTRRDYKYSLCPWFFFCAYSHVAAVN